MTSGPRGLILAAGESSRLWPLRDKALVRLGREDLLGRQLRVLASCGIREVVVVASPGNESDLRASVIEAGTPLEVRFAVQGPGRPGMGGAVLAARDVLGGLEGPIYVTQAHDVTDPGLHVEVMDAWRADRTVGRLVGWRVPEADYFPGGYIVADAAGRVSSVVEKPGRDAVPPGRLVTIVAHLHPDAAALCAAIEAEYAAGGPDDHYERAMSSLFETVDYRAHEYDGPWRALKYPWHLLGITRGFLAELADRIDDEGASVSDGANVVGPVHLGAGARILWGAEVRGPAWIGPDSLVGQFAQVRESYVGAGCVVGTGSEVNRSYVGDGATMHAARVLDSVIAQTPAGMRGANLSAGVITANLRIDHGTVASVVKGERVDTGLDKLGVIVGAGAFVSIQAGTMPGTKLGEGAIVYPGTMVYRDVSSGATVGKSETSGRDQGDGKASPS